MSDYVIQIFLEKKVVLFANSGDPDRMLHSAVSDLGLHCLPITLFKGLYSTMVKGDWILPGRFSIISSM